MLSRVLILNSDNFIDHLAAENETTECCQVVQQRKKFRQLQFDFDGSGSDGSDDRCEAGDKWTQRSFKTQSLSVCVQMVFINKVLAPDLLQHMLL